MTKKIITLDELSRYDTKIKDYADENYDLSNVHLLSSDLGTASTKPIVFENLKLGLYFINPSSNSGLGRSLYFRGLSSFSSSLNLGNFSTMCFIHYIKDISTATNGDTIAIVSSIRLKDSASAEHITQSINKASSSSGLSSGEASNYNSNFVTISDVQTIRGTKYFNVLPRSSVVPSSDTDLVNKKYVDDTISDKITYSSLGINNYDNSSTYSIGDYTRYLDGVYKCNTAIETAEDFDSSKWTQSTILEYLRDALNIPSTGVNESNSSDIDNMFNSEEVSE